MASIENIAQVALENSRHFLPKREKLVMKEPSCKWMNNALQNLLNFYKQPLVKTVLACQNNLSPCFAPKYGLNGLREMLAIFRQWGIILLWKHNLTGGWFIYLTIGYYLEKSIRIKKYFVVPKKLLSLICTMPENTLVKIWQVLKIWFKWLWENARHFLPEREKLVIRNHNAGGRLMHLTIYSSCIKNLCWILYCLTKTSFHLVLHLNMA